MPAHLLPFATSPNRPRGYQQHMQRQNTEAFRLRCVRRFRAIGLTFGGVLLIAASGQAGVLDASWTAPTTNTDGSTLTDLALYRVYYGTSDSPCPGGTLLEVASPSSNPPSNETVGLQLTGLTTGSIYSVSVTAVDIDGAESACSDVAWGVARDDSVVTPTDTGNSIVTPTETGDSIVAPTETGNSIVTPTETGDSIVTRTDTVMPESTASETEPR